MAEDKDPFAEFGGKPISTSATKSDPFQEFGGTLLKKKASTIVQPSGLDLSGNGLANFQGSPQSTELPLAPLVGNARQEAIQQREEHQAEMSNRLKKLRSELPAEAQQHWDTSMQAASLKNPDQIRDGSADLEHYNFMQTPVGKTLGAVQYLGSKATKGGLQVARGVAHLAQNIANPSSVVTGGDPSIDAAFEKANENTNFGLTKGDQSRIETGGGFYNNLINTGGMAAEFAPAIAGGEALGSTKALMYLQGLGQGQEQVANLEKNGQSLNPAAKELLIQGSGVVNLALEKFGDNILGKVPTALRTNVVNGIVADAVKESAGKDLTQASFKELLNNGVKTFADKFERAPVEAMRHYNETAKTLTKLNVGNYLLHKGVDAVNDKPVFNDTIGDLAEQESKTLTHDAPLFSAIPALRELTKLAPNSAYKNDVVESVVNDPSHENVMAIKQQLYDHGFHDENPNKWTPEEMDATFKHIDQIADVAKKVPSTLAPDKKEKAIDLILGRNELEQSLKVEQDKRAALDPSMAELPTAKEQFLTDKIDQANDKLKSLVTGKRTTYSKGVAENEGKFFKTTDGKQEEIEPARYDMERTEREAKAQNETTKNSPITPQTNESNDGKVGIDQEKSTEEGSKSSSKENNREARNEESVAEKGNVIDVGGEQPPINAPADEQGPRDTQTENTVQEQPNESRSAGDSGEKAAEAPVGEEAKPLAKKTPDWVDKTFINKNDGENFAEETKKAQAKLDKKAGDPLRAFADKVRQGKINKLGGFRASTGFDSAWDASLEVVAKAAEGGAKIADAIEAGLKHIKSTDWYKNLTNKEEFDQQYRDHLSKEYADVESDNSESTIPEESGLSKASVTANRKVIGLKDVNKPEKLEGDQEYLKAREKVNNGALSPYEIAERIIRTRDTPTIEEFNALLYQNRVVDNHIEMALSKVEDAEKNGSPSDKEDARNQLLVLEKNKDLLHNAARNVSYNWGFMGRMLQEAVKKDYTLSNLRSLFRAKADGEIPADIESKLNQYVKERDEAVKKLEEYQSKEAERAAQIKIDRERRANTRKIATEKLDKAIEDTFASISKKLKAQRATLSMNPIPIEMLPDIGKLVNYYSQKGIIKAADIADNIYSRLKDDIEGLTPRDVIDAMAGNGYQKETKSLDELQKQKADIKLQSKLISRLEDLESGRVQPSIIKSKRSISDEVQSLRERIKKSAIDQGIPLDNLKKNLQSKLDDLEKTIKGIQSGEIEAPKKTQSYRVEADQEALRLKAKVRRAEKLIDELGADLDQRREKNVNKFLDGYTKLRRFSILSRIGTLAKLRSAAMGRQLISPVEEALGAINKELPGFRKIAERSPRFSKGLKISAEIKAMSQHYTKETIADNNQVLKEGHGELDYLFDPKAQKETEMSGFPGRLHAWLKNSTKRAEFQRSFEHIMQWEKQNNPDLNINDPAVQERVGKEAYNEARRSIFMNDNMAVDLYNNVLNFAERNWGTTGKTVATAFRALMPIVKIPTNFALESADYATLGARAIPTVLKAAFKGAESLSPKEADFVMRMMRKGQLGGALMAMAYFNPNHFGGYNVPGQKRDKNDLHQGDLTIGDFKVPHLLQHIPLISAMQAAATLRRTRDFNIEKGKEGGTYKGMINGFMGLMENVPFLSAPSELEDALKSDNAFNSYVGSMVKNQVELGFVQEIAEQTDTKDGGLATISPDNAQKRYPDTKDGLGKAITDNLKMGIPGLREQVSGEKPSEVDKSVKKIKLPNGPEFELNDEQVKDREKINDDFIQKNGARLKSALERKALTDKTLLKKIHDRSKVWKEHNVSDAEKKKFKQDLVDDYVAHHIKLIANKHSMPYIYKKYKNDLKLTEE